MSDTTASLRRKINSAGDLQSVVRTMKAVAASSIGQYEAAVRALGDYYRTVELGLGACFRERGPAARMVERKRPADRGPIGAIVFGSDQGLVGRFNEVVADYTIKALAALPGKPEIWAVGERVHERLDNAGLSPVGLFPVPNSVKAITPLVGQIQIESEMRRSKGEYIRVYVFHNRPQAGALYEPVSQRLLPLDAQWQQGVAQVRWPSRHLPEVMGAGTTALRALLREYLFISLFRACAESLASENASRLAAMQRAEKNIDNSLEDLNRTFHRLRQSGIDEELFDVVAGFEALSGGRDDAHRLSCESEWIHAETTDWALKAAAKGALNIGRFTLTEENIMQIQINTDHNIEGCEALSDQVSGVIERALDWVSDHITRVEVHLSDENGDKGGQNDKRCMMEARLEGRQPVAVTHQAATLDQAVEGAADKLVRLIESTLGRRHDRASRRTDPPPRGLEVIDPS